MTNTPVASNVFQSSDVILDLTSQLALNNIGVLDHGGDPTHFVFTEITRFHCRINACPLANLHRRTVPNPKDVGQRNVCALIRWDVDTLNPWHPLDPALLLHLPARDHHDQNMKMVLFTLSLLVTWVHADDAQDSLATDQLAVLTDPSTESLG